MLGGKHRSTQKQKSSCHMLFKNLFFTPFCVADEGKKLVEHIFSTVEWVAVLLMTKQINSISVGRMTWGGGGGGFRWVIRKSLSSPVLVFLNDHLRVAVFLAAAQCKCFSPLASVKQLLSHQRSRWSLGFLACLACCRCSGTTWGSDAFFSFQCQTVRKMFTYL